MDAPSVQGLAPMAAGKAGFSASGDGSKPVVGQRAGARKEKAGGNDFPRLAFGFPAVPDIETGVARLAAAVREARGSRAVGPAA